MDRAIDTLWIPQGKLLHYSSIIWKKNCAVYNKSSKSAIVRALILRGSGKTKKIKVKMKLVKEE